MSIELDAMGRVLEIVLRAIHARRASTGRRVRPTATVFAAPHARLDSIAADARRPIEASVSTAQHVLMELSAMKEETVRSVPHAQPELFVMRQGHVRPALLAVLQTFQIRHRALLARIAPRISTSRLNAMQPTILCAVSVKLANTSCGTTIARTISTSTMSAKISSIMAHFAERQDE